MAKIYPQGSVWRRWDPHVHTPGTALNDQFKSWEAYIEKIEADTQVVAIGVTDYLSIRGYKKLREEWENGRLQNIDLLFPNIEFRILPPTDKGFGINIHLLVSPDDPDHERKIEMALRRLTFHYGGRDYSCVQDELIELGRAFRGSATLPADGAYRLGVEQFKPSLENFRRLLESDSWLRANCLVAVQAGTNDGASGLRDSGLAAVRDNVYGIADIIFSGRPGERDFWLARDPRHAEAVERHGGPKPCLHGSDAHSEQEIFRPDQDRFCWIKADPSFEGLRQIIHEPGERVHIGPTSPDARDRSKVLKSITLTESRGWFPETTIPLNAGLVGIIGSKGSGKTALGELAAYAARAWTSEPGSFIKKAGEHIEGLRIHLEWDGGADPIETTLARGTSPTGQGRPMVRYLSQSFVERLCSADHDGAQLVEEIENVIFSYLPETDTLNASCFAELRAKRTATATAEQVRLAESIRTLNTEIDACARQEASIPGKRARIDELTQAKSALEAQLPPPATQEEAQLALELNACRQRVSELTSLVAAKKDRIRRIEDARARIKAFDMRMREFFAGIGEELLSLGVPPHELEAFRPVFGGDIEAPILRILTGAEAEAAALAGTGDAPAPGTLAYEANTLNQLEQRRTSDEAKQALLISLQRRIAEIDAEIGRVRAEVAEVEGEGARRRDALLAKRDEAYAGFFKALGEEQAALEALYSPVQAELSRSQEHERPLEFYIRRDLGLRRWVERGIGLFDKRRALPDFLRNPEDFATKAEETLSEAWRSGKGESLSQGVESMIAALGGWSHAVTLLRSTATPLDLVNWIYEIEHLKLTYGIRYNGTDLNKLSPGTKGILLLILFLQMDKNDDRPLIIDQPEENLDNESVYKILSGYFREAKRRRQVIVITHNPNLVVNTDAEQVIVARCERRDGRGLPQISYTSGSLEEISAREDGFPGVRKKVCEILEGGERAFRTRERKYDLRRRKLDGVDLERTHTELFA